MPPLMGIPLSARSDNSYSNIKMSNNNGNSNKDSNGKFDRNIIDRINGVNPAKNSVVHARTKNDKLGKDEFLRLLTFQLQNQDPTNPLDDKKLTGELAQFSQLEQLAGLKTIMEQQGSNRVLEKKFYSASLIGKKITTNGIQVNLDEEGGNAPIRFALKDDAARVMVRIFDGRGNMVAQLEKENMEAGNHQLNWNGKNLDGSYAEKGKYNVQVVAHAESGQSVEAETKTSGIVTGVEFDANDNTILLVNGNRVDLREVNSFEMNNANGVNSGPSANEKAVIPSNQNISTGKPLANPLMEKNNNERTLNERTLYDGQIYARPGGEKNMRIMETDDKLN